MSADPHSETEPFNRLSDMADVRGCRLGIKAGDQLHTRREGEEHRDLVELQCKLKGGTTLYEPIRDGDLQGAAGRMQRRVGGVKA